MTIKNQVVTCAFSAIGLLMLGCAALADEGFLPPGSTACTDQVRSNQGAIIYGRFLSDRPPTRALFMSETPDGDPIEISPKDPPPEGIFFFRACVTSSPEAAAGYTLFVLPHASATDYTLDIGRHTAALAPGGKACGSFGTNQDRRVGDGTVPVLWTVITFDGDLNLLEETSSFTGDSVDDVIALTGDAAYFEICVTNSSDESASVSFDSVHP
jgi:hypothetical protein